MAINYVRPGIPGESHDPFDWDGQVVKALVGAFAALAEGHIDRVERDEAGNYIHRLRLAQTISRQRIAGFFDARARHLENNFADLIADALRSVGAPSLTFDVVRIAELVAAADRHVDANEEQMVRLIRLIAVTSPVPKLVDSSPKSLGE